MLMGQNLGKSHSSSARLILEVGEPNTPILTQELAYLGKNCHFLHLVYQNLVAFIAKTPLNSVQMDVTSVKVSLIGDF